MIHKHIFLTGDLWCAEKRQLPQNPQQCSHNVSKFLYIAQKYSTYNIAVTNKTLCIQITSLSTFTPTQSLKNYGGLEFRLN